MITNKEIENMSVDEFLDIRYELEKDVIIADHNIYEWRKIKSVNIDEFQFPINLVTVVNAAGEIRGADGSTLIDASYCFLESLTQRELFLYYLHGDRALKEVGKWSKASGYRRW